jgi:L-lactate dehydrogenase complex protein LldG
MADSRADILARIEASTANRPRPAPVPRDYDQRRDVGDLVQLAAERIADYRATVHVTTDVVGCLRDVLTDRGVRDMVAPAGVPADWRIESVRWLAEPLSIPELDQVGGVLTGCALVIAETGTIVLDAGPDQGRRASTLVPDYHLCVVRAAQIVGTVPEAIARLDPVRPITFISGPSATSDIEFDRVEGVHGPRTLDVVIVT